MKLSAVLASVTLVLGVCLASPLEKNEIFHLAPGREYELSHHQAEKFDEYGCDQVHTSSVWGQYIPDELQQKAKDVNWQYNKYLGKITEQYWFLLGDTKKSGMPVNGLPAPQDRTFDVIPIPGSGLYLKMVNAKTQNLATLQNKSLDIDYTSESVLLSMVSTEKIHLVGQLMGVHDSDGPALSGQSECDLLLNPGVRFQLLMDMKKDEEGHYHVTMNQCKFDISQYDDAIALCEKGNDGKDSGYKVQVFNHMAQLLCQQVYYEQVKDEVEQHIRQWHPYKRAETYANAEIYQLMEKFRDEKLKNDIEVGYNCVFEKQGYKVHFENVKIHGQDYGFGFHSVVPATYTLGHGHHVDTMFMTYRPLSADFTIRYESDNRAVNERVTFIAPVKIALHFSTDRFNSQASFSLRYHPDVMIGGIHSEGTGEHGAVKLTDIYGPTTVNVFIAYVQREMFDFLYPGALQQPEIARLVRSRY